MARTKAARTRLSDIEHEKYEAAAARDGVTPAEWLRRLIVSNTEMDLQARVTSLEQRLEHVESELARMWSQEGRHDSQVS